MYQVPESFHKEFKSLMRSYTIRAKFNGVTDVTEKDLMGITVREVFDTNNGISIGSTCSSYAKIKMCQPAEPIPLTNGYVELLISNGDGISGVQLPAQLPFQFEGSGGTEIPLGKFYITDISGLDDCRFIDMTAYDGMTLLEREYEPTIGFPARIQSVAEDICRQCGVTLASGTVFPEYEITTLSQGNCKTQIGWIAGLMGKNARFNRDGELSFVWYESTGYEIGREVQYADGLKRTTADDFAVRSLTTGTEDNVITVGSGRGITCMNPYVTQDIANAVFASFGEGLRITPSECKWRGDPSIEPGDIISAPDKKERWLNVAIMEQEFRFNGGMSATIYCYGKEDAAVVMDKRPSDVKLEKMYGELTDAFRKSTDLITGQKGGYYRQTFDEQGFPTGWVVQDTPTLTPATKMWIMSLGGLGFSEDGGETIKHIGITMDGAINADTITTGHMQSKHISVTGGSLDDFFDVSIDDEGKPVVRIGASGSDIILRQVNDRIGFYDTQGTLLAYFSNNSFEIVSLKLFRLGETRMVVQPNGSLSIV